MIGVVLAAGAGSRLAPLTDDLPKTLLPVDGDTTILDIALGNLAAAGLEDVVVVTGVAAYRIEERLPALSARHGVRVRTLYNDRAHEWNNAYSLWLARGLFTSGVLLCNGDTVHPASVERRLLDVTDSPGIVLAIDDAKPLADEEMKVLLDESGRLAKVTKRTDPAAAAGEYIGVTRIDPAAATGLAESLEATWRADPSQWYEDGFQHYVDHGGTIGVAPIGTLDWVEVDDHADLARARTLSCRS